MRQTRLVLSHALAAATVASRTDAASPKAPETDGVRSDDTWISVSGEVRSVTKDTFVLSYQTGVVTVRMDDGDRDAGTYDLQPGDEVTVNGKIDDAFFDEERIEASSTYVRKLDTVFYAHGVSSEDRLALHPYSMFLVSHTPASSTLVQGIVTEVSEHAFSVKAGAQHLRVNVGNLSENPLDDEGFLRIRPGDTVRAYGKMDEKLFRGRELIAEKLVKLSI
jgi:uncharacterized protein YdeI (BOF family)